MSNGEHTPCAQAELLRSIYGHSLDTVDHLRIVRGMLEKRGVQLTESEQQFYDEAMNAIGDIQALIEQTVPLKDLG